MKSLFKTIVSPVGERYNNSKDIDGKNLILNASIDIKDYQYVNRVGVVVEPSHHEPIAKKGDLVLVHHNVFRQYWGFSTHLRTSSSDLDDGTFAVTNTSIYAVNDGSGWKAVGDYCFVEPIEVDKSDLILSLDLHKERIGKLVIGAPDGSREGDTVAFTPFSEYEFEVDGKKVYRMRHKDLTGIIV